MTSSHEVLRQRIRELAFLNKGLRISLTDLRDGQNREHDYMYEGGIKEYVAYINKNKTPIHDEIIYVEDMQNDIKIEVSMQYNDGYQENIYSFCNNINTHEGGTHEEGFRLALTRVINNYARKGNFLKEKDDALSGFSNKNWSNDLEIIFEAIFLTSAFPNFVFVFPSYWGSGCLTEIIAFKPSRQSSPDTAKIIVEKAIVASHARLAAKKAREMTRRKTGMEITSLPGKLADCSSRDACECEIFTNSCTKSSYHTTNRITW